MLPRNTHDALIQKLRAMPGVMVEENDWSWLVRIPERGGFRFEIIVPMQVLEWFVTAYDTANGSELWSDWAAEYSFKGGPSEAELPALFAQGIEFCVSRLNSADGYRVSRVPVLRLFGKNLASVSRLDARVDGEWQEVVLGDFPGR